MSQAFYHKTCAVLGVGISNLPLIDQLLSEGAQVTVRDKKTREQLGDALRELERPGVRLILGQDYLENLTEDYLFRSPGIRPDEPHIAGAVAGGSVLTSEMELFFKRSPAPVFGITGSDGKTTTTHLTRLLLETGFAREGSGRQVFMGGNVGVPLLPRAADMTSRDVAVAELSSFQLSTMTDSPRRAVITNITPNHLNWHTDMAEYISAKCRIFRGEGCERLITNAENAVTAAIAAEYAGFLTLFSSQKTCYRDFYPVSRPHSAAIYEREGVIYYCESDSTGAETEEQTLCRTSDILLPGRHNVENYMAAMGLTHGYVTPEDICLVARTFPGVEHRLEFVRETGGVRYYNSSIDSSPTRTAAALSALPKRPIIICGGYDKHIPFAPLAQALVDRAKTVILTGATAQAILAALRAHPDWSESRLPVTLCPDFDRAVQAARDQAVPGDIVLLSPACASFDAFPNFEVRGRHFKQLVNAF